MTKLKNISCNHILNYMIFSDTNIIKWFDITRTIIPTTIKKYITNHMNKYSGLVCMTGGVAISSTMAYYCYSNRILLYDYYKALNSSASNIYDGAKEEKGEKNTPEEPYENKYYDLFENMERDELEEDTVKGLQNSVLYEMTPKGRVILYYDFEKESFVYYCDTKDIPYLYLETVARKYAVTYDCKKIVVDIKKEMENAKQQKTVTNINTNTNIPYTQLSTIQENANNTNDMFASFKSYNRKGTGGSKTVNKKFVLRQNANRYSYNGKTSQFPILKTDDYKIEKPMEKMDYETFKKLMAKKN